jgi:prepilin-type N-terminal cleavage/methylation domain-containing protein
MRRSAFTLPELLVVIGIIVVLVAMLLPSLSRAWAQAQLVSCQNNVHQFGLAMAMYENDNHGYVPFANWNWDPAPVSFSNAKVGWLYSVPLQGNADADYMQSGNLWPYINTEKVYHCPAWEKGDQGSTYADTTDVMTSYLINGAVSAYGNFNGPIDPATGLYPAYYFKVTQFNSDDILMWETAEQDRAAWNDGATFPDESYNPSILNGNHTRHGQYLPVLSADGHVESMSVGDYWRLATQTDGSGSPVRNRLWCNPQTKDGHQF